MALTKLLRGLPSSIKEAWRAMQSSIQFVHLNRAEQQSTELQAPKELQRNTRGQNLT